MFEAAAADAEDETLPSKAALNIPGAKAEGGVELAVVVGAGEALLGAIAGGVDAVGGGDELVVDFGGVTGIPNNPKGNFAAEKRYNIKLFSSFFTK